MTSPSFITVELGPPIDETEFWRDVEATTRLSKPSRAKAMILDLAYVRALSEAQDRGDYDTPFTRDIIHARMRELLQKAEALGFPMVPMRHIRFITVMRVH